MLQKNGCKTACIGKWHMGLDWPMKHDVKVDLEGKSELPLDDIIAMGEKVDFTKPIRSAPTEFGFDYFFGTAGCSTTDPPYVLTVRTLGIPNVLRPEKYECDPGHMVPDWVPTQVDTQFVQKAVEFIEENRDNPFFLYLPLSSPHGPHLPPEFVKGRSEISPRADMVLWFDWSVGEIMYHWEHLSLAENTLLIVTSDNGPLEGRKGHKSAGNLRGYKASIWEGGHRVPFVARWPGKIKPNSKSDEVICLTDLFATCTAIFNAKIPDNAAEDSYNILHVPLGEKYKSPIREATVHHSGDGVFAIRQGPWKLIEGKIEPTEEKDETKLHGQLYNLAVDPYEQNSLWDEHPEIVKYLKALLEKQKIQGYTRPR
jgi:arylsulfatase A